MELIKFSQLYKTPDEFENKTISVCGWVRTIRDSKNIGFIALNDGSCFNNVQVVFELDKIENYKDIAKQNVGAALNVTGKFILTPDAGQPFEINADKITVAAVSSPEYPLQKKRHSLEYLRTISHIRPRANIYSAAFRVRSQAAFAIHQFFNSQGFVYAHTPLISCSDCEGAGEMFRVTTLDLENVPKTEQGEIDYSQDFFQKQAYLTVSGQLQAEAMALAFGNVYTFGPTFRAEKSYTQRHAAEFWMVEPEMAFTDLQGDMKNAEAMIKYVIKYVMDTCPQELAFFNQFVDKGLIERLESVVNSEFGRITYTDAVKILEENNDNYPKEIKAFYMRLNDDGKTVAAMDCLVMGIGEIIGGSQREERLDLLEKRIEELGLEKESYEWYLDLRRYGGVIHSGYGLGFERLVMYLTGISNIRDVLPFPRTTGSADL